jgi:hypothetical protein
MSLYQKIAIAIKLRICQFVDFTLLPTYYNKRFTLFESLGSAPPPFVWEEPDEEMSESGIPVYVGDLPENPKITALEILQESLSSTVWVKRDLDGPETREYLVQGLAVQTTKAGSNVILVLLQDKFSHQKQPIPLFVLLGQFQPVNELQFTTVH